MLACPTFLQVSDETERHDAMRRGCCERRCCNGRNARRVSAWLAGFLSGSLRKLISVKSRCQTFLVCIKQSFDVCGALALLDIARQLSSGVAIFVDPSGQGNTACARNSSTLASSAGRRQQRRIPRNSVIPTPDAAPLRRAMRRPAASARHAVLNRDQGRDDSRGVKFVTSRLLVMAVGSAVTSGALRVDRSTLLHISRCTLR